jgi:hypothetical protein
MTASASELEALEAVHLLFYLLFEHASQVQVSICT